jgi:ankyrin repeat protein
MQTPLFYCSKYNKKTQVAEVLIDAGCDINRKDANGQSCIFYAAAEGNL